MEKLIEPVTEIDVANLRQLLLDYRSYLLSDEYFEDNDWYDFIAEEAIRTIFGVEFWTWWKAQKNYSRRFEGDGIV